MFNFLREFIRARRLYNSGLLYIAQTNPMYIPKRSMVIKNKMLRKRNGK